MKKNKSRLWRESGDWQLWQGSGSGKPFPGGWHLDTGLSLLIIYLSLTFKLFMKNLECSTFFSSLSD